MGREKCQEMTCYHPDDCALAGLYREPVQDPECCGDCANIARLAAALHPSPEPEED